MNNTLLLSVVSTLVVGAAGVYSTLAVLKRVRIKALLPTTPYGWRFASSPEDLWVPLAPYFAPYGLTLWPLIGLVYTMPIPLQSNHQGYWYKSYSRHPTPFTSLPTVFECISTSQCPMQMTTGQHVVCRAIVVGKYGISSLAALRRVATGINTQYVDNHVLPLLQEIDLLGITFGIFPYVGCELGTALQAQIPGCPIYVQNSVIDLIDIFLQCLEALSFIHACRVAHRDAYTSNFLIQYYNDTARKQHYPTNRPRVYLIDFETAICFPEETPYEECFAVSLPAADLGLKYTRTLPPGVDGCTPYNPFALDVFQLVSDFRRFKTCVPMLDEAIEGLGNMSAEKALETLSGIVVQLPPASLMHRFERM